MKTRRSLVILSIGVMILATLPFSSFAESGAGLSRGQILYVPAYSHIYSGNSERPFLLTVTLSIRNIDLKEPITLTRVDYYETQGTLVTQYLKKPLVLKPLESIRYIVPENDRRGGSGANFIVTWTAEKDVNAPIAEAIMIGTQTQQGISFISRGREILNP